MKVSLFYFAAFSRVTLHNNVQQHSERVVHSQEGEMAEKLPIPPLPTTARTAK